MIKLINNDIFRDGTKIGWIIGDYLYDHNGKKLGFATTDNLVYDEVTGKKLAHIDGDFVYNPDTGAKTRLEEAIAEIETPALSNIMRVAIRIFFGN